MVSSPSDQSCSADAVSTPASEHARIVAAIHLRKLAVSVRRRDLLLLLLWAVCTHARAAVSPEAAAQLGTTLTPMGAERAGNADGSIPAWTGGMPAAAAQTTRSRPDPFANERPLFSITASNLPHYNARVPEGAKA